ncbi:sigma factor-like helix-turn-helix DNA-binding protein [Agrococcus sp. KRD186]|uniref:sigma factor-like helix-turn-helix DNA-binding protein n=1 Tax=Agrococcus sp. KRD186 TaxID=2729730 RepID=UPI0019CFF3DD|nr:sigma factor-like helix-turn-helix DNA-binding protein [Agrococcus sp. KRD186]
MRCKRLFDDPYSDPEQAAELADSLTTASLLLLERLSPLERAAFVLHEVFAFDFAAIAETLGRSEAACRQLAARARRHMDDGRTRYEADAREAEALTARFLAAMQDGDVEGMRSMLAADAVMPADGGGKAPVWGRGTWGADRMVEKLAQMAPAFIAAGCALEPQRINGRPGAIFRDRDGRVLSSWGFDVAGGVITAVRIVLNPDKLQHLGQVADAWALLREAGSAGRGDGK